MSLTVLKENERIFSQPLALPVSLRISTRLLTLWHIADGITRQAEKRLAHSIKAKAEVNELVEKTIPTLDAAALVALRSKLLAHLEALGEARARSEPQLLAASDALQTALRDFVSAKGLFAMFARRQAVKALSACIAMRFAFDNYEEAVVFAIEKRVNPAIFERLASSDDQRKISIADRQFSPERQVAVRERIGEPSAEAIAWGEEVVRRRNLH